MIQQVLITLAGAAVCHSNSAGQGVISGVISPLYISLWLGSHQVHGVDASPPLSAASSPQGPWTLNPPPSSKGTAVTFGEGFPNTTLQCPLGRTWPYGEAHCPAVSLAFCMCCL